MKKVLVLGAGLVAKPLVDYLADLKDSQLTVADIVAAKAEALTAEHGNAKAIVLDASDESALSALVQSHDIAVSLLPGSEHPRVARLCLDHGKHMTTASYVGPAMRAMDAEVAAEGVDVHQRVRCRSRHGPYVCHAHHPRRSCAKVARLSRSAPIVVDFRHRKPTPTRLGTSFPGRRGACSRPPFRSARYIENGQIVEVSGDELFSAPEIVEFPGVGQVRGLSKSRFHSIRRHLRHPGSPDVVPRHTSQ